MFETLETRRMLSVTARFDDAAAMYRVNGNDDEQHIEVVIDSVPSATSRGASPVGADMPTYDRVRVYEDGALVASTHQPANAIKAVEVNAQGGDDVVIATNHGRPARLFVSGGAGSDRIETTSNAGAPGSSVRGDAGDDVIGLASGKGSTGTHVAYGGGGNDTITGSDLDDVLLGDDPFDATIRDGNDVLFGGAGNDALFGGGGNDYLDGQAGIDQIDGGTGFDTAVADKEDDQPKDVEQILDGNETGADTLRIGLQGGGRYVVG